MLDKIIKQQLDNLEVATISEVREGSKNNRYLFKKINSIELVVGKKYVIKLTNTLLNKDSNPNLVNNWNHGKVPTHNLIEGVVKDKLGTMNLVEGVYVKSSLDDIENTWSGWLPLEEIIIVREM